MKVLVSDPIDQAGLDILGEIAQVEYLQGLSNSELCKIIGNYDALMIRSGTRVTAEIIENADKLKIIGRAGVGVDNVDVDSATKKGILVVNSPGGNTIAAAEHAIAMLLALSRNIPQAHATMVDGDWSRKKFVGNELHKKTLGVVGLGKIGSHVAKVANALGMYVLAFDPYVSKDRAEQMQVELSEIDNLFALSDYVSLHLPRTKETENLVDSKVLSSMKSSARLVNCARGGIINELDLANALNSGEIAGAAIDVYAQEPLDKDSPLRNVSKGLIMTPHLGASTKEAQENVSIDVAEQIRDVLNGLPARSAVNIPGLNAEVMDSLKPHLKLAETLGLFVSQLAGNKIKKIEVNLQGEFAKHPSQPLIIASLKGMLTTALGSRINYVNASLEAKARGIEVIESKDNSKPEISSGAISLKTFGDFGNHIIGGTVLTDGDLRITSIDEFPVNLSPSRFMLLTRHRDMPGIIGQLGSLLGKHNINIASMQVGRKILRGEAIMVLSVDDSIPSDLLGSILSVDGINKANLISL